MSGLGLLRALDLATSVLVRVLDLPQSSLLGLSCTGKVMPVGGKMKDYPELAYFAGPSKLVKKDASHLASGLIPTKSGVKTHNDFSWLKGQEAENG
ncbi:hypothetical protein BTVI_65486 [Pitangus sulphuratus]|nr:hypothetical protein BTVI_65486 [Pitangus sulphuratus]